MTITTNPTASGALRAIALYKLFEASVLIIVGIGTLRLLDRDLAMTITRWLRDLHIDPNRAFIHALLARVTGIHQRTLEEFSIVTFVYAALRVVEGVGLWLQKSWAEYLIIVTTGLLLPVEVYEIAERFSVVRLAIFAVNVAVVIYLAIRVVRKRRESKSIVSAT